MKKIYNYFAEIKKACEIRISEEYTDDAVIALIKKGTFTNVMQDKILQECSYGASYHCSTDVEAESNLIGNWPIADEIFEFFPLTEYFISGNRINFRKLDTAIRINLLPKVLDEIKNTYIRTYDIEC